MALADAEPAAENQWLSTGNTSGKALHLFAYMSQNFIGINKYEISCSIQRH
jgi:hypothetical protein